VLALKGAAGLTSSTTPARLRERPYDMISNTKLSDVGADLSDDTRHLVAEHRRRWNDVGLEWRKGITTFDCLAIRY
jgi:hypothetical protein